MAEAEDEREKNKEDAPDGEGDGGDGPPALKEVLQLQLTAEEVHDLLEDSIASLRHPIPIVSEALFTALVVGRYGRIVVAVSDPTTKKKKKVGRVCRVTGVVTKSPPYEILGLQAVKYLELTYDQHTAVVKATQLSDGLFSQAEVSAWLATFDESSRPTKAELVAKWNETRKFRDRRRRIREGKEAWPPIPSPVKNPPCNFCNATTHESTSCPHVPSSRPTPVVPPSVSPSATIPPGTPPTSIRPGPPTAHPVSLPPAGLPSHGSVGATPTQAAPSLPPSTVTIPFIPAAAYAGPRHGYYFANGARGLGYYLDSHHIHHRPLQGSSSQLPSETPKEEEDTEARMDEDEEVTPEPPETKTEVVPDESNPFSLKKGPSQVSSSEGRPFTRSGEWTTTYIDPKESEQAKRVLLQFGPEKAPSTGPTLNAYERLTQAERDALLERARQEVAVTISNMEEEVRRLEADTMTIREKIAEREMTLLEGEEAALRSEEELRVFEREQQKIASEYHAKANRTVAKLDDARKMKAEKLHPVSEELTTLNRKVHLRNFQLKCLDSEHEGFLEAVAYLENTIQQQNTLLQELLQQVDRETKLHAKLESEITGLASAIRTTRARDAELEVKVKKLRATL